MTTSTVSGHTSVEDHQTIGERASELAPLSSQADWEPAAERPDPVELLVEQNATREADLVPVRHGRMTVSPFTFYRGAAKVMASDLATTPMAGLVVQLCGDAHLSNFGGFASPERELLFGLNDFDETLARAVRVRPEADGRQLHHRSPQQRLHSRRCASGDRRVGQGLPVRDGRARRDAHTGNLVRAHDRTRHPRSDAGRRSLGSRRETG